ncbi:unannotated protein [freshwater metagenome]|uniref:Unannotated protein n=1 Tax=freshwater metagenome TaxID=449393 RepID=A0A6J6NN58_9ZZZZ
MATLPSKLATVRRNASTTSPFDAAEKRETNAGITLASVVMGPAIRRPCSIFRSAWLSTSPFSAATKYGPGS